MLLVKIYQYLKCILVTLVLGHLFMNACSVFLQNEFERTTER